MGNAGRFTGRVALVTGGASGIGAAVARRLADERARVASLDLEAVSPNGVLALAGDVSSSSEVEAAVAEARSKLGPIDILVCSAGVPGASLPTVEVTDEEWRRVMGINADGVFYCNRAVIPEMVERGYGRIVNVASIAGKEGNPMAGAYSASKAAVIAMTKAIGKDVARTGVLVNCVAPAVIETPMLGGMSEEHVEYMVDRIPMGRIGEPKEVAALICWLASEECSFSTGATYDVSGGRAVYEWQRALRFSSDLPRFPRPRGASSGRRRPRAASRSSTTSTLNPCSSSATTVSASVRSSAELVAHIPVERVSRDGHATAASSGVSASRGSTWLERQWTESDAVTGHAYSV